MKVKSDRHEQTKIEPKKDERGASISERKQMLYVSFYISKIFLKNMNIFTSKIFKSFFSADVKKKL